METVAAFEVPLSSSDQRAQLVAILREAAKAEGGHVDVVSDEELRQTGKTIPAAKMTIHVGVWGDENDKEPWATALDLGHVGLAWITFARGKDEGRASGFRMRAMRNIHAIWPNALSLPVINRRTIPLPRDLVKTPTGYKLNPSAASRYES